MTHNDRRRHAADGSQVSTAEEWDRKYWCKEFGCTEQQLLDAVKAVGTHVSKVREFLSTKR